MIMRGRLKASRDASDVNNVHPMACITHEKHAYKPTDIRRPHRLKSRRSKV